MSFRWKMGDYVGGDTAVHQAYKPFLCLKPDEWAAGEFLVQPRDTNDIVVSGLGFQPDVIFLIGKRARTINGNTLAGTGGGMTFGVASGTAQFTGSTQARSGLSGQAWSRWREDVCFNMIYQISAITAGNCLTLSLASMDADGFTLNQSVNLFDTTEYVAWLALKGTFKVGVMDAGDTSIGTGSWTPEGAVFLSVKHLAAESDPFKCGYWDHMQGFASRDGNRVANWGGKIPTAWDWTTERWSNSYSILLCKAASSSYFTGATVQVEGAVTAWYDETNPGDNDAGLDLQWDTSDGNPYRIGYVLTGDSAEAGVLETSWNTRPGGSANIPGTNENLQSTSMTSPDVILMAATNYNFSWSDGDPMNWPRSADAFWSGGSGGLGWHVAPFSALGYDAYGVHMFGNGVAERGHYSNSGVQYMRRAILAGQGANSNPPAYHQHSVNVIAVDQGRTQIYRWIKN